MQPIDLQHCANVARNSHGGNLEVSRCLLDMAIQISQRDPFPDYNRMNMYYDLISTAGTRQKAFQKIEDFLQLMIMLGNQETKISNSSVLRMLMLFAQFHITMEFL